MLARCFLLCAWLAAAAFCLGAQAAAGDAPAIRQVTLGPESFVRGAPLPPWVHPEAIPATSRTNPYVIRLADTQFRLGTATEVFINRAAQINDAAALTRFGQYPIEFAPDYQKLRLHRVEILRGDDVIDLTQEAEVRFLQRETGLERGIYSGEITALVVLKDLRVGDTVHVAFTTQGSNPVFGQRFSDYASWDADSPIELRKVRLSVPDGRQVAWQMLGDRQRKKVEPILSRAPGWQNFVWEERGIDGVDPEPFVPSGIYNYRSLQFSEYADWRGVAHWAQELFPAVGALPAELDALVTKLNALPGKEAKIVGALQWVQDEIRYFSVALGESSHRPTPPAEVLSRRFGDCKDKTYLLVTLLRRLGIDAHPTLVAAGSLKTPGRLLPSPQAFDHAIVAVRLDGATWFLDPTRIGQRGELAALGQPLEGAEVLVVTSETTALQTIRTPAIAELTTIDVKEEFSIPEFGKPGGLAVQYAWRGANAENVRNALRQMTPEQQRKFALSAAEQRYPGSELAAPPQFDDDQQRNLVRMKASFNVPKPATDYDGDWVLRFIAPNLRGTFNIPPQAKRQLPLFGVNAPYAARYQLEVTWPDTVAMVQDPSAQKLKTDNFALEVVRSFRGNRARLDVQFDAKTSLVAPDAVSRLMEDLRKLEQAIGGTVVVARSAIKRSGFLGLGRSSLQDTIRARLQTTVERTSRTIADGRLRGDDLADVYCNRAESYVELGQLGDAQKDAEEAVRLAPDQGNVWSCRGSVRFASGDYLRAAQDYSKALGLGHDEFNSFYRRGQARFYQGKLSEAAADFAKAAQVNRDQGEQMYADLWQIWTRQRLQEELPADLRQRAGAEPYGAWPRPALAMLVGLLTPDQVLQEIDRKQGDERQLNLAEGWFYIGQYWRVRKRDDLARDAFRKTREQDIPIYVEHTAAGIELGLADAKH